MPPLIVSGSKGRRPAKTAFPRLWERRKTLDRQQKEKAVAALNEKFGRATGVVLTEYKGMTVAEISDLRNILRPLGIEYKVVKNTLARIASDGTPISVARAQFKGPVGIAITYGDPAMAAKKVLEYSKTNQKLKVTGGVVDGSFYAEAALKRIADLPSREVMLGMLAGTLQAPTTKMARLLSATVAKFAFAMSALKEKREKAA